MKLQIPDLVRRQRARPAAPARASRPAAGAQVRKIAAAGVLAKVAAFNPILARDGTEDVGLTMTKAILTFGRRRG